MGLTDPKSVTRLGYMDFLKFIGITCIVIAHANPPEWLMMLRNFDVCLMVILSTILAARSYQKHENAGFSAAVQYVWVRIKRLVIPTWIFLIFYFLVYLVISGEFYDLTYYISTFCLTRYGKGYVWVILIYVYTAILTPVFHKIGFSVLSAISVTAIYVAYEIAFHYHLGTSNPFIETTVYYFIPYGFVAYWGYNLPRMKKSVQYGVLAGAAAIFGALCLFYWQKNGHFTSVQIAKYSPRLYYVSYGIGCTYLLILLFRDKTARLFQSKFVQYISKHSMWFYLWHIFVLAAYNILNLPEIWYLKFPIVYTISLLIVFVVNKLLDLIEPKLPLKFFQYLRG